MEIKSREIIELFSPLFCFFICYHSKESPVLIDMFAPGLLKIPEGSRGAFSGALGWLRQRAIIPRCAVQIRGPCSPERARSKMGYPANEMLLTRAFRVGLGRFPDIARPPGHRLTPDRFHPLRKSSLCIANIFFGSSHFSNFLKL